jgi:hypothetical protein
MKSKKSNIIVSFLLMFILTCCKYEKDPGLFNFNGPIQGQITDHETGQPVQGASVKIEFENSGFDPLTLHTDDTGFYSTEIVNIHTDSRIKIDASKMPEYDTLMFNGIDLSVENTFGVISANVQADKLIVNFGLNEIKYDFDILPDTLFYEINSEDTESPRIIYQNLTILNMETGQLTISVQRDLTWIFQDPATNAEDPLFANEFHIFKIGVDRSVLTPGKHDGHVLLDINGEITAVPVMVTVY